MFPLPICFLQVVNDPNPKEKLKVQLANSKLTDFLAVAVDDLNTAIHLLLEAGQLHPRDVSALSSCHPEASTALKIRFYVKGDLEDLRKAIEVTRDGLSQPSSSVRDISDCEVHCASLLEDFSWLRCNSQDVLQQALQVYDNLDGRAEENVTVRLSIRSRTLRPLSRF